jgi:ribose 5-phosphate isomerase B
MKVYIGADHDGFEFKSSLTQALQRAGHEVVDVGNTAIDGNDDFPQFADALVTELKVANDPEARGILISGSGHGMAMAANRFTRIRASLCWSTNSARTARNDDDSNVLCLSSRYLSLEEAGSIMATWLATPFGGDPGAQRHIQQIDELRP